MRELFDHTADLGLRVRAEDLPTLFAEAGACLYSAMIDDIATIQARVVETLEITGDELDLLFFDWLRALLLRTEETGMLFSRFDVQMTKTGLLATIAGEPIDRDRHPMSREVKAITYHELKVVRDGEGWLAEAIVDI